MMFVGRLFNQQGPCGVIQLYETIAWQMKQLWTMRVVSNMDLA